MRLKLVYNESERVTGVVDGVMVFPFWRIAKRFLRAAETGLTFFGKCGKYPKFRGGVWDWILELTIDD